VRDLEHRRSHDASPVASHGRILVTGESGRVQFDDLIINDGAYELLGDVTPDSLSQ